MQKIKDFILSINFAILVLFMIGARITIAGASIGDALALIGVCGLQAFYQWIETKKQKPLDEQVQKELSEVKAYMSGMALKNSIKNPPDQGMKRFF